MEIGFIIIMLCLVVMDSRFIYLVYHHGHRSCKNCKFFRPTANKMHSQTIKDEGFLFCDSGAWVKDIVPIPLIPSILEKNGYKQVVNQCYIYQHIENDCYEIWKNVKNWTIYWRGVNLCSFKYLHELQHILLFLGLNSEMEV